MQIRKENGAKRAVVIDVFGLVRRIVCVLLFLVPAFGASAQGVQLTPEQQRLLNQLPPSQREAALQQINNLQVSSAAGTATDSAAPPTVIAIPQADDSEPEGPPVFAAGDTVVLGLSVRDEEEIRPESIQASEALLARLLAGNPYRLNSRGQLVLAGVGELGLAGLTAQQASLRLNAEPALANFQATATLLPLAETGVDALRPFGYELFQRSSELITSNTAVPVAADYIVGAGDTVRVQLFGNVNAEYELPVDRSGVIRFPEIGPLSVAGLSYVGLQEMINQRVSQQIIGTQVSVTLGELRALQVFVVGDVNNPGSYVVRPMSTITSALAQSGGVSSQGSLRRVQLKRDGRLVQTLDVYDLLLRGDTRSDVRLRAGDVVFVPPVGTRVTVSGDVNRPAIYEYKGAANVADAIMLAGGLRPTAHQSAVKVERFEPGRGLRVVSADQTGDAGRKLKLSDGDTVIVPAGVVQLEDSILLAGNVQRPGAYEWRSGLRVSDLVRSTRDLKEGSDLNYLLIRREEVPNAELDVLSVDIEAAWKAPGTDADVALKPRDTVYVFDLAVGRNHIVEPLLAELQLRTSRDNPLPVARVGGRVNAEGQYPIETGMRVSDLIRAAGGLSESAYPAQAELTRYDAIDGEARRTTLVDVDLQSALAGNVSADILLQPSDYLNIKEIPRWREQEFVEISGEVVFPGRYPIKQSEMLSSVIARAGGLTDTAFPRGSVFTRESLKEQEREQLEVLADRLESDLASMSLSDPGQSESISTGQSLLNQLRSAEPIGRLVIDLEAFLAGGENDVVLRSGDSIHIPTVPQEVTVIGEVQYSTSHLFETGLRLDDYIDRSGGTTRKADERQIYVVRASGEVVVRNRSRFFSRAKNLNIEQGDTIVVPLYTDRLAQVALWANATQIIYQLAIAAAAVNSF